MNDSEHHPKVKVTAVLGSPVFVAGGAVYGKIEIESRAEADLGLRCIFVELSAVEQLTSKYHAATSQFINTRRLFQGPSLPPSNAVRPRFEHRDSVIPIDYYPARKGVTSFLFKLSLPANAPSSLKFGGNLASVTYLLKAGAEVFWRGERRQVVDLHDIVVVESPPVGQHGEDVGVVIVGEGGKVWTHGKVLERVVIAGQPVTCRLHVKNNSLKKISGLSAKIMRKLRLDRPQTDGHAIEVSDTLLTVPFDGPEYTIQSFSEGVAHLVVTIPRSARGLRQGPREALDSRGIPYMESGLFHVQCYLVVSMSTGFMTPAIEIHIPLQIYHRSAVPEILRVPSVHYMEPTGIPPLDPSLLPPEHHIPPMYSGYFAGNDDVPASQWAPALSPPPASPQHQFYFDAYSETQFQPSPWAGPSAVALIEPPPPIPPRPLSAGPSISRPALLEMPYILPYPENSTFLTPAPPLDRLITLNNEPPPRVELIDDRASRISRHLRLTSRHRSVSPPRARSLIAPGSSPSHLLSHGQPEPAEPFPSTSPITPSGPGSSPENQIRYSPPLLSPRPRVSSGASYFESHSDDGKIDRSGSGQRSPQVVELERIAVEQTEPPPHPTVSAEMEDYSANQANKRPAPCEDELTPVNKTLPRVPTSQFPTARYSTAARGLPAAAFGESTVDSTIISSATPTPATLKLPEREHVPSGLTLLEMRLRRPAAYEIFSEPSNEVVDPVERIIPPEDSHPPVAKSNLPRKAKKQEPRPVKSKPEGRRLESEARVAAWLQRDEVIPENDQPTHYIAGRNQPDKTVRSSGRRSITENVAESHAFKPTNAPPVSTEDAPSTPLGLKAQPQVAINSSLSQLDWRTLDRETYDYIAPTDSFLSQQPPRSAECPNPMGSKYDVRSARGGRGGVVTSAAAFWSAVATSPSGDPSSTQMQKVPAQPKPIDGFTRSVLPLDTLITSSPPRITPRKPHFAKFTPGTPAAGIINNTLAKPVILSPASLAKPSDLVAQLPRPTTKPPVALFPVADKPKHAKPLPAARSDMMPLGRERLQELISRYQNSA